MGEKLNVEKEKVEDEEKEDAEEFEDFDDFQERKNESGNESDVKLD